MFEAHHEATRIASDWPIIVGGKLPLPKPLADAIATYEAADAAKPPATTITVADITPGNAAQVINDAADAAIRAEKFHQVKAQITGQLAQYVLGAAVETAPEILDRLKPEFDTAVEEFTTAVQELPDNFDDPAALVASGPTAVDNFHRAVKAQGRLKKYGNLIASIPGSVAPGRADLHVLRLLKPVDRAGLKGLLNAGNRRTKSELSALYLHAVEHGIEWQMNTPAEQREIADRINAMPLPKNSRGW